MINHLGTYFREQRLHQGLSLGQLARIVGYRNVSKGSNKICRFERQGEITQELLVRLAAALGVDCGTVEQLIEQDHQESLREWEEWVSQPTPMSLIVKYMPAVYGRVELPDEIATPEQAETFACDYARVHHWQVCLAVSRRMSVWIDKEGQVYARTEATPDNPNVPFMRLQGSRRGCLFGFGRSGMEQA